jgi:hypothetical protein
MKEHSLSPWLSTSSPTLGLALRMITLAFAALTRNKSASMMGEPYNLNAQVNFQKYRKMCIVIAYFDHEHICVLQLGELSPFIFGGHIFGLVQNHHWPVWFDSRRAQWS